MKRIVTILSVVVLGLYSCNKDEVIEKDYDLHQVTLSFNSEEGENTAQVYLQLDNFDATTGTTESSDSYVNFVIVRNPDNTATPVLEADGDWDLVFTKYAVDLNMGAWYNGYETPGVLLNMKSGVSAVNVNMTKDGDSYIAFENITLDDAQAMSYSQEIDVIGYGWKKTDITANPPVTNIVADNYYLVKVSDDEIYKLKFTDYYGVIDGVSEKGNVTFTYQLLQ